MVFVTLNNLSLVKFSNFNQVRGLLGRGLHIAYVINVQNDLKRLQLELFNYLIDTRLVIIRIKFDAWHHNSAGNHKTCQKERHSKIMKPQKLNTFNLFIYLTPTGPIFCVMSCWVNRLRITGTDFIHVCIGLIRRESNFKKYFVDPTKFNLCIWRNWTNKNDKIGLCEIVFLGLNFIPVRISFGECIFGIFHTVDNDAIDAF